MQDSANANGPAAEDTPKRRLSDAIIAAFETACQAKQLIAASHLLSAVEAVFIQEANQNPTERRKLLYDLKEMRYRLMLAAGEDQPGENR